MQRSSAPTQPAEAHRILPVKTSSGGSMTTVFQGADAALKPAIGSGFQGFWVGWGMIHRQSTGCLGVKT